MAHMYNEGDRVLRYINGEWVNVTAKCERQKNLGFFIDNDNDGGFDQHDNSQYMSYNMKVNDDDEDDFSSQYPSNHRPDLFWIGDGFRKEVRPKYRSERVSTRHPIIQHFYDYQDDCRRDSKCSNLLFNRYSTIPSVTLVEKNVLDGGKRQSICLPTLPPPLALNYPKLKGYHPYSRPIISTSTLTTPTATAGPSRIRMRENLPRRITVPKCCCCESTSGAPSMLSQINTIPFQMEWLEPKKEPLIENDLDQGPSTIVTKINRNTDELRPIVEDAKQTDEPKSETKNNTT